MSSDNITSNNSYSPDPSQIHLEQKKEDHSFELEKINKKHEHEIKVMEKELGALGRLLGSYKNASKNITALICITLLIGALIISTIVYYRNNDTSFVKSIWTSIV